MATLYELTDELLELMRMAEDPDIDPQTLADTMEGVTGEFTEKAEGYGRVIREVEADIEKYTKEIERLTNWKSNAVNSVKRMKDHLMMAMIATDNTKFKSDHFKFSVAKNGGLQPLHVDEIEKVPAEYIIHEPKVDTDKIRKALNDGQELPFAYFKERGQHLSIR